MASRVMGWLIMGCGVSCKCIDQESFIPIVVGAGRHIAEHEQREI